MNHTSISARWVEWAVILLLVPGFALSAPKGSATLPGPQGPWKSYEVITPAELASELARSGINKPVVVCVGFKSLYDSGHVRGAICEGPTGEAQGLAHLRAWAKSIPKNTLVVIYCGCCPFQHCPNVRPAFQALHEAGFTRLRVLYIPHDFVKDWERGGYPMQRGHP